MNIDPELLNRLRNPLDPSGPALVLDGDQLLDPSTGDRFPIVNGIPQLLPESVIRPRVGEADPAENS